MLERARAYRPPVRAGPASKRPAFKPKGFDELLNHGVYLHNRGEFEEALKFLRQAAEIHPQNEHVLYCLAATAARAGDTAAALKALRRRSIRQPGQPRAGQERLRLRRLRDEEEFVALVYRASILTRGVAGPPARLER